MKFSILNINGAVRIQPTASLQDTADALGLALCVDFAQDPTGKYDEFPSYTAECSGLSFVLLGIPEDRDDIFDFCLQIGMSFRTDETSIDCDASTYFAALLTTRCNLRVKV